jgi:hypothetical protein
MDGVDDCIHCGVGKYLDYGEGATLTQRSTGDSNSGPGVRATLGGPDYATVGYDTAGDGAHDTAGASLQVPPPARNHAEAAAQPATCSTHTDAGADFAGTEADCLESAGACRGANPPVAGSTTKAVCEDPPAGGGALVVSRAVGTGLGRTVSALLLIRFAPDLLK